MLMAVLACAVFLLGFSPGSAGAASITVSVSNPTPIVGEMVTFTVAGVEFPANDVVGGDWGATWNNSVLKYLSLTFDPVWDLTAKTEVDALAGGPQLDRADGAVFCTGCMAGNAGLEGPSFSIAQVLFEVIGAGTSTFQTAAAFVTDTGWSRANSTLITIDNYGNATVSAVVPVPASAWLFGSALGLLGWVRRRAVA